MTSNSSLHLYRSSFFFPCLCCDPLANPCSCSARSVHSLARSCVVSSPFPLQLFAPSPSRLDSPSFPPPSPHPSIHSSIFPPPFQLSGPFFSDNRWVSQETLATSGPLPVPSELSTERRESLSSDDRVCCPVIFFLCSRFSLCLAMLLLSYLVSPMLIRHFLILQPSFSCVAASTKIGAKRIHTVRTRGGNR